jgi:NADPH:quinone reductase
MGSEVMSTAPPPMNQGDDIAGIISEVGSDVIEYKPGDRVGAFHRMLTPGGSYAEYAVAPATTTFHLPENISFEEAATLPLSGMTACLALYQHLKLPLPWDPVVAPKTLPVLIYGGASAVGAYALQFAKLSGLSPIITVAGNGQDFVRSLNVADHIIDYRHEDVPLRIKEVLQGKPLRHAFDAISHHGTWEHILKAMGPNPTGCQLNMVDPPNPLPEWPTGLTFTRTYVASAYGEAHEFRSSGEAKQDQDFAFSFFRYDLPTLYL